ncbi:DNA repair protein RecO [Mesoplasma photuris]|uniref:DNA repair protein RecO n=1 Tax=Mesoplasma photuris TaxID=217731 RepID=UPI00146F9F4A|nr:DNA repair protein RecO [Mesoplasma photuris]
MPEKKMEGIVINSHNYEENDKIVTIFSDKYGKLSVIAKGVNKPVSKNKYSIQTFNISEFEIFKSSFKDKISKLKTGVLIKNNIGISDNYDKYLFANLITSVINDGFENGHKNYEIYKLLKFCLNNINEDIDPFTMVVIFLFKTTKHLGAEIQFKKCIRCNLKKAIYRRFDFKEFGLVCFNCIKDEEKHNESFIDFLQYLDNTNWNKMNFNNFDSSYQIIFLKVLINYYENIIGIKTPAFYELLKKPIFEESTFTEYTHSVLTKLVKNR